MSTRTLTDNIIGFSPVLGKAYGVCGALILQQIHYWLTAENPEIKEGNRWVYRTHAKWAEDLMVYNEQSVRNKIHELEAAGILITGNYNQWKANRTKWYRIDYTKLVESLTGKFPLLTISLYLHQGHPRLIVKQPDHPVKNNECHPVKITECEPVQITAAIKETPYETPNEILASHPSGKNKKVITETLPSVDTIKKQLLGEVKMSKQPTSSAAILAAMQKKKAGVSALPPNTTKSLKDLWQSLVPQHHPTVGMMVELTLKKQGQLGAIAKTWGLTADKNMAYVVRNWVAYTKFVSAQKGLKLTPDVPDIGFIQKYVGEANSFVTQAVQLIALAPKIKLVHKPASVEVSLLRPPVPAKKVLEAGEEEASLADVLAWKKLKD